jgi:hypothetical protein
MWGGVFGLHRTVLHLFERRGIMRIGGLSAGLAILALCGIASADAVVGFDTAVQAVLYDDGATATYNAGGWVDVSGASGGDWSGLEVDYAYGDMSSMPTITMDLIGDWTNDASNDLDIAIFSTGWADSVYLAEAMALGNYADWTTVTIPVATVLAGDVWGGTTAGVMADVAGFSLYTFPTSGASIDNLGFIPEPTTLCLLGISALALIRRRRSARS